MLANQRFRLTQNIVNVVCVLYALAIGLVVLAGVVHLAGGVAPGTNPTDWSAWSPSADTGINLDRIGVSSALVVLALLGVEVPLNMGVEIKDERSITPLPGVGLAGCDGRRICWRHGPVMVTVPGRPTASRLR